MRSGEAGAIRGLDHVTLVVGALAPALAAYETLFDQPCDARGEEHGLAWANFALANTALVLVAPARGTSAGAPGLLAAHVAPPPTEGEAALGALAFAVDTIEAAARLLERRGLPAAGPPTTWRSCQALPLSAEPARGLHLLLTAPERPPAPRSALRLDHLVIRSGDPERSIALLAGRLGLGLRLDRSNPDWGQRLLFFRCGDLVLEVAHPLAGGITQAPDRPWGMTWRVPEVAAWHARLETAGIAVSPLRTGRKPGTRIFTIRDHAAGVPTAFIGV